MSESIHSRYQDIPFADSSFPLVIAEERISEIDHASRDSQIFHEELEIKYFYEGSATLVVDASAIVTQPGDIVIINPYEFHSTIALDKQKGKYCLFMVGLDLLSSLYPSDLDLRRMLIAQGIKFNHLIRGNEELVRLLRRIALEHHEKKEHYQTACRALFTEFFIHLLREEVLSVHTSDLPLDRIRCYALIAPALRHIHTAYHTHITVDQLAECCSVSKFHFCRLFRQGTGQTAMQYLMEYRLNIACVLLETSEKSCREISALCGFTDESYFGRAFKKQYGFAPHQYRARLSEK